MTFVGDFGVINWEKGMEVFMVRYLISLYYLMKKKTTEAVNKRIKSIRL